MIVPAVFVFSNGDSSMLAKGPSLMFVMLPKVFNSMAFSSVIAAVFFILVLLAALTSSISLLETLVAVLMDKFHMKREMCIRDRDYSMQLCRLFKCCSFRSCLWTFDLTVSKYHFLRSGSPRRRNQGWSGWL